MAQKQSICWTCTNAYGQCPWSQKGCSKPVDGWRAEATLITNCYGPKGAHQAIKVIDSYCVKSCPLYKREKSWDLYANKNNYYEKLLKELGISLPKLKEIDAECDDRHCLNKRRKV